MKYKYTLIIPNNRINFHTYALYLSKQKDKYNFQVVTYDSTYQILSDRYHDSNYTIVLSRYCFIDFDKLSKLLNNQTSIGCILGEQELTSLAVMLIKSHKIKTAISVEDIHSSIIDYYKQKKLILNISKYCFLSNLNIISESYHNAIFACLDDNADNFGEWLDEFQTKQKTIYYKNKSYTLKIGKEFFIKNNKHLAILPSKQIICWNNKKHGWYAANKNIKKLLHK